MPNRVWLLLVLLLLPLSSAFPQGLTTTATRDEWEEINFETGSAVLSDGYPSMLRLADLLRQNPRFQVKLVGHTDSTGDQKTNEKLAQQRAAAVKQFLEKYGAQPGQVTAAGAGQREPKVANTSPEGRFMNRRVSMAVNDETGKQVSAGGVGDAIKAIEDRTSQAIQNLTEQQKKLQKAMEDCCSEILKRMDTLAEILKALEQLRRQNSSLKDDMDKMRQEHDQLKNLLASQPKPLTASETAAVTEKSAEKATTEALQKSRMSRFTLMGLNAGADDQGRLTFSGRGRYFAPFQENFAVQAQAEYLYFRDRKEGQFDLGLVDRMKQIQAGLFASFKNVQLREYGGGGTLGQASFTFDYFFKHGKIGAFGTKGFLDNPVLRSIALTRTLREENYLKIVDQVGVSTALGLYKKSYLEGNVGYLKSRGNADRPGGTLRFVYPVADHWALTLEGGMNETLLSRDNNGRVVGGVQWGNFLNPREFAKLTHPVPADVPRVRFEVLTRRVRSGNDPPVADAGVDQIGVTAGALTLDGSGSYDPEGDPIKFQWAQVSGPAASLSGANSSRATFTAAEGQSYAFRLTVTDDKGASSVARVLVTTARALQVTISRFTATPQQIKVGQSSVLNWGVENAESVLIDGIGSVDPRGGTTTVSPQQTTTYKLAAKNRVNEVTQSVTVVVDRLDPQVIFFTGSPMTVQAGQSASLSWQTQNADAVEISGLGAVAQSGNTVVKPERTTTYTLTARNRTTGAQGTAQVTIQVAAAEAPKISRFSAAPAEIAPGDVASLVWAVENATTVSISTLGNVSLVGSSNVTPQQTTTYRLTASNAAGEVTADATVTVIPPVRITSFKADPQTSTKPGTAVTLTWTTQDATDAVIDGLGTVPVNGSVRVNPTVDTTYTLRAFGRRSQTVASVTVRVTVDTSQGPVANAGPDLVTTNRDVQLDGSRSNHPGGLVIGFSWRALGRQPELVLGADTATPAVRFAALAYGEYLFELTVTDSQGRFSKSTVKVFFGAY
ncbi:MAG: OmpA family protein [Acidobacteria bacterium]|nr:OmpA family protein [Acidobacteriota bacterium]